MLNFVKMEPAISCNFQVSFSKRAVWPCRFWALDSPVNFKHFWSILLTPWLFCLSRELSTFSVISKSISPSVSIFVIVFVERTSSKQSRSSWVFFYFSTKVRSWSFSSLVTALQERSRPVWLPRPPSPPSYRTVSISGSKWLTLTWSGISRSSWPPAWALKAICVRNGVMAPLSSFP